MLVVVAGMVVACAGSTSKQSSEAAKSIAYNLDIDSSLSCTTQVHFVMFYEPSNSYVSSTCWSLIRRSQIVNRLKSLKALTSEDFLTYHPHRRALPEPYRLGIHGA